MLLPFLLASLASTLVLLLCIASIQLSGSGPRLLQGFAYLFYNLPASIVAGVLGAWATWLVLRAYRRKGVAREIHTSELDLAHLRDFLSARNPMLISVVALCVVQALLSAALMIAFTLSSPALLGPWPALLRHVLDWLIRVLLSLSIFGILVEGRPALSAIGQSVRIARGSPGLFALMFAILLASYGVSYLLGGFAGGLLGLLLGSYGFLGASYVVGFLGGAIMGALQASCLAHAFLSARGYLDGVHVASGSAGEMPGCPGSPRIPDCLQCRHLQEYGEKYFCSKFGRSVAK